MDPINYTALLNPAPSPTAGLDAFQNEQVQSSQRALAANQVQMQLRQQALQQAALSDAINNPSPQAYRNLGLVHPEITAAIKNANDSLDEESQRQSAQDITAFHNYLDANRPDDAVAILQKHIDAAKRAGQDASAYESMKTLAQSNPKQAQVMAGMMLSTIGGADKMASAYSTMEKTPGDVAKTAADTALATAQAKNLTNPPPKTQSAGLGPDGQPIFYNENAPPPANIGAALGSTTNNGALSGFVQQLSKSENNTGNPGAKNPNSTATGDGQFLDKTWQDVVQKYRPDLTQGKSPAEILALRKDPELSAQMIGAYAQDNAQTLGGAGLPVNGATLAMAHKLGPGAAQAVLRAAPGAKLSSVLSADAIKANPQLANMTAGQYGQQLANTFGTTAIDASPGDPNATGDAFLKTLPPARARMVQAIANGDLAVPPAIGRNAAQSALLLQQVLQYDPTATAINLPVRKATQEKFTSGPQGLTVNSLNTFAGHADKLNDAISQLGNSPIGIFNKPAQVIGEATGDAKTLKAVANFNTWKGLASNEIVKVLRGSAGAEGDIKYWQSQLDSAKAPLALHQVVQSMAQAVQSRLESLQNEYNTGMATLGKPVPQVMPSTTAILNRLAGNEGGSQQASNSPPVATNAQGQRVVYDAGSRTWKPG